MKNKYIVIVVLILLFISTYPSNIPSVQANPLDFPLDEDSDVITAAVTYLLDNQGNDGNIGGITVSAWTAMALKAAEIDNSTWGNLIAFLKEKSTVLDENKATDWERHLLAIVACNENPSNFNGINFIDKITDFFDGTQIGDPSILYDDCFGILSLISAGVSKESEIIQQTKSYLLGKQRIDGGWGDVDSTSACIMALRSTSYPSDSHEISTAFSYLKTKQENDGGFYSWENSNAASTAWAVMAMNAGGKNPTSNEWQIQGNNPITYLLSLQNEDGSFNWSDDQQAQSLWMTSYVIPALLGKYYPVHSYEPSEDENHPPNRPALPYGSSSGEKGKEYFFKTVGTDPDNDRIRYRFDWDAQGNHDYSDWTELEVSGKEISLAHTWEKPGTYLIKAQIKDEHNATSPWSDGLTIDITEDIEDEGSWTGQIRIEGENDTIWKGAITVKESYMMVTNNTTDKLEEHYFPYPTMLGAIDTAAEKGGFSYRINYHPEDNAYFISSINNSMGGWHFFIDFSSKFIGYNRYELDDKDHKILLGYLSESSGKALKISSDKTRIKKHKNINIIVKDQKNERVNDAIVIVDDSLFLTKNDGLVTVSFSDSDIYYLYAEKEGYIRSDKIEISVIEDFTIVKPKENCLYLFNKEFLRNLKNIWIIGPITFDFSQDNDIKKVELFINDELIFVDNQPPFQFHLNQRFLFKEARIIIQPYMHGRINYGVDELIETLSHLLVRHKLDEIQFIMQDFIEQFNNLIAVDSIEMNVIIVNLFPNVHNVFENKFSFNKIK